MKLIAIWKISDIQHTCVSAGNVTSITMENDMFAERYLNTLCTSNLQGDDQVAFVFASIPQHLLPSGNC